MKKQRIFYYLFWLKSSRGTNEKVVRKFAYKPSNADLKYMVEEWASHFGAWDASENYLTYGHREVTMPSNKEWSKACKIKERAVEKWKVMYETLLARNTTPRKE
jgi:hypothetical protein